MLAYLDTIIAFTVIMLGFSLLITLLNQMISAFLGYRGSNLRWGIQTLLTTLDPDLSPHAQDLANRLLTNPIVSDSIFAKFGPWKVPILGTLLQRWKLASAIGPDALVRTLTDLAKDLKEDDGTKPVGDAIDSLLNDPDPGTERKVQQVKDTISSILTSTNYAVQLDTFLKQLGNSAQQSIGEIEAWFNVAMNRVSQRFTMQIRIWTVVFAFLMAFGLHLDSFNLFNQLLVNPALRQKLVEQSGTMLKEADAVLATPATGTPTSGTTELTVSPEVLKDAMMALIARDIDKEKDKPESLDPIPSFNNISEAENWLVNHLRTEDVKRKNELATKYRERVIAGLRGKAKDIADLFQQAGIELIPGRQKLSDLRQHPIKFFFGFDGGRNVLGVLLTAGLLGLGAPFWYNALKTLANLRPMVATRQDQQKQDAAAS